MLSDHPSASDTQVSPTDEFVRPMNAIRVIVRALRMNARAIEVQTGISLAQLYVLQQLAERPAHSLNDLAARTSTHQSSVSVVVRRLVERGLVSRTAAATDKRRVEIAVTPAGLAMVAGAPTTIQASLVKGLHTFTSVERQTLAQLMEHWVAAASISLATPPMLGEDDAATSPTDS